MYTAESWTVESSTSTKEYWIPTVIARRRAASGELASTFVSLLDPYEKTPQAKCARRLDRDDTGPVRVEVELSDGRRDSLVSGQDGVSWQRRDAQGRVVARREIKAAESARR